MQQLPKKTISKYQGTGLTPNFKYKIGNGSEMTNFYRKIIRYGVTEKKEIVYEVLVGKRGGDSFTSVVSEHHIDEMIAFIKGERNHRWGQNKKLFLDLK